MFTKALSKILIAYYRTPEHPGKEKLWEKIAAVLPDRQVVLPFAGRGWITVDLKDPRQKQLLVDPKWESEIWYGLARSVERDEVFWDVGAYTGLHSLRAVWDPGVREVHCFEGAPGAFKLLLNNLKLNDGAHYAHPFTPGISGEEGPLLTIDSVIRKRLAPAPTLIRIFAPGAELEVLQGAWTLLTETPPKAVVFEAPCDAAGVLREKKLRDYLESCGLRWKRIEREGGEIEPRENYVAVPERKPERKTDVRGMRA